MERMIQVEKENVEQPVVVEREPMTLNIGGTTDYNGLSNKPSINGTTLSGDKSLSDLGINIPDVSDFITKDVNDLTYYTLATNTGSTIELTINNSTYVMTLNLKNASGTTISTQSIDLPLETMVVNGSYDNATKKVILTLQNGNTVDFSVADLVSGLQSEITSNNKLSSDLVDDTNHTNKFVTSEEKEKINIITNSGTGNNYLANDGTYKEIDLSSYAPKTMIGDLEDLDTTDKSDIVSAINEVAGGIKSGKTINIPIGNPSAFALNLTTQQAILVNALNSILPDDVSSMIYNDYRYIYPTNDITFGNNRVNLIRLQRLRNNVFDSDYYYITIFLDDFLTGAGTSGTYIQYREEYHKSLYNLYCTFGEDCKITGVYKQSDLRTMGTLNISKGTTWHIPSANKQVLPIDNSVEFVPTGDFQPSTKKYVDDSISSAVGDIETILTTLTTGNGV